MPVRNSVKTYVSDGVYHIYNRGVEKRTIFLDHQDYTTFLRVLKDALSSPQDRKMVQIDVTFKGGTFKGIPKQPKTFYKNIELLAYCLMSNHFHLLIKQKTDRAIHQFLHSVSVRYAMYFNKKYKRSGPLFQSVYKAALVTEEPYFLHVSRYIHLNPKEMTHDIVKAYSSYADYLGKRHTPWLKPDMILSFFNTGTVPILKRHHTYRDFVESVGEDSEAFLGRDTLENTTL